MTKQDCEHNNYQAKNNANTRTLRNWTTVWVITMAIAAFAPRFIWDFNTSLTIITLLINLAVGFRMLVANRDYLRGLDEMQQKILFDAMAFTLGVGLVLGLSYELLEDIKLIGFEPEISHLIIVMCLTYLTAMIAGHRKYR
ncbi:hypothetical protein [Colwellia psychrerythraea]|uniref:Uncharacterized protein n=1 Tax=Colwellia psychrerythraea (strain 34H / ATCC BAA-681) TaxID=167879 RepID=Q486W2_COLP3|nr:hypothetical protein [Colwellia psychrerythraea]AAZ26973.1 hypothetical protein CPS_1160 [Colwellia psychrerythraea 34H]